MIADRLLDEHNTLAEKLTLFDFVADETDDQPFEVLRSDVQRACAFLADELVPHLTNEHERCARMYERDGRCVPDDVEREIARLAAELATLCPRLGAGPNDARHAAQRARHILYELHALARMHFADTLEHASGV